MRLIDADELKERFRDTKVGRTIKTMVDTQPTAYDIDKVMKELEEECFSPKDYPGYVIDIERAIEIVEKGGNVNE